LPGAKRIAVFINPANDIHRLLYSKEVLPAAAAKLGFQLDLFELRDAAELPEAVAAAKARGAEALSVWSDPLFDFPPNRVPDLALLRVCRRSLFFATSYRRADCVLMGRTLSPWVVAGLTTSIEF